MTKACISDLEPGYLNNDINDIRQVINKLAYQQDISDISDTLCTLLTRPDSLFHANVDTFVSAKLLTYSASKNPHLDAQDIEQVAHHLFSQC